MEEASTGNAKVSDSGYSNTCSNSQSQKSSGSLISRNSNRSESSGYCGRRPSTFGSSNEALPQPISKRKDKEHKKKSKTVFAFNAAAEIALKSVGEPPETALYNAVVATKPIFDKKTEEIATVELVDATDPGEHNGNAVTEASPASRVNHLDDSTSQANVSIHRKAGKLRALAVTVTEICLGKETFKSLQISLVMVDRGARFQGSSESGKFGGASRYSIMILTRLLPVYTYKL